MSDATRPELKSLEAALGRTALFQALSEAGRARLLAAGSVRTLEPQAMLCAAGDEGDALYVLIEGEVEVRRALEGGREVRLAALGPGAVLGEMAVLDGGPRSADMSALRRTRVWRIPRGSVLEALETEPKAALTLVAELCRRLRAADAAIEDAAVLDLGGRLARLLLELGSGGRYISLSQAEMGRRIAASREKVNRKLQAWREQGAIAIGRAGVQVVQEATLRELIKAQRAS